MMTIVIGVLHPGEMGAAVGAAARQNGARVIWASADRGPATRARAQAAGLEDVGTVPHLVAESGMILSICPPAAAPDVARNVAALGFRGVYVDGNAVSPDTTRAIGDIVSGGGARFVDGGIIGPPPHGPGTTRLYVAGEGAAEVAARFARGPLTAIALDGPVGAASALKMAYAGWNKGSQALLLAIRALAAREGVDEALVREWALSMPDLPKRTEQAVAANTKKAWRFVGEMHEIAATFASVGLPEGFHEAAAEVFQRLAHWKDAPTPPSLAEVQKALAP
jgi:3-hydroxyisobutyrate dehydrogenase-like beta-hydroxyacid dehydrogenase